MNIYPEIAHECHLADDGTLEFSQEIDDVCNDIHAACEGFGTDEESLTDTLGAQNATNRYLISQRYEALHGKKLSDEIDSETGGKYGRLLELISMPIEEAECKILRDSTKGAGTTEKHIYPILCGRSNAEIEILKKTYYSLYDEDLNVRLASELGGDLNDFVTNCMQELTQEFDEEVHTEEKAEEDADAFYNAGQGKWGTDEKSMFNILCSSPPQHLIQMNLIYAKKYGYTLDTALKKELGGKTEDASVFAVNMSLKPYEAIAQLFESTMKGFGTDEEGLSYCIVRYHHVLSSVCEAYEKKYDAQLRDRIHGETSGKYRDLLLTMMKSSN